MTPAINGIVVGGHRKLSIADKDTILLVIDMQESFRDYCGQRFLSADVIRVTLRLLEAAKILGLRTFVTEHVPQQWGHTIAELQPLLKELNAVVLPKVNFSAYSVLKEHLAGKVKNVIVCGVAAHCCVFQTAVDLLEHGLGVHVVVNATTTYNPEDRHYAFEELRQAGAVLTTADRVILQMVGGHAHPQIAQIDQLFQEALPEMSLLSGPNTG